MGKYVADSTTRVAPGATVTVSSVPGKLHFIQASSSSASPGTVTLYDSPAAAGTRLLVLNVASPTPYIADFFLPLRFNTGLTIVCSASVDCHVVIEQEGRYT
jgi:hypothetical protein